MVLGSWLLGTRRVIEHEAVSVYGRAVDENESLKKRHLLYGV